MRGMEGADFVRSAVAAVKPGDLEIALTCLPFADALRLLPRMCQWLDSGSQASTANGEIVEVDCETETEQTLWNKHCGMKTVEVEMWK